MQASRGGHMRRIGFLVLGLVSAAGIMSVQAQQEGLQPLATMKQLMVEIIHPASNEILLFVSRGSSQDEKEWDRVRRSAITLAEAANLLTMRSRARDQGEWVKDAKLLADVGAAAYKAAEAKDAKALDPARRSEEHTSELQSHHDLVCRLLLEKKRNP